MAYLEVRDLRLHYGSARGPVRAVDSVSLRIAEAGTTLGVIGETGSGKSSFALALSRVLPNNVELYEGQVLLEGVDLMTMSNEQFRREVRWKKISVVFQGAMHSFNPVLRLGYQLTERMRVEGESAAAAREAVEEILEAVGVDPSAYDRYPHELSGGMKQRGAIALALTLEPSLVILDEPTSAVDVSVQAQIMNLLKRLKWERGLSMLFVTHDIALASDLSDHIAVMYAGEIREIGTCEDVLTRPQDPYTQELLSSLRAVH